MHVYVDSSALIKRVVAEKESTELLSFLDAHYQQDDVLATSSLGLVEVSRAVIARARSPIAAVLIDADVVVTYDDRLADACRRNSLAVASPGRD